MVKLNLHPLCRLFTVAYNDGEGTILAWHRLSVCFVWVKWVGESLGNKNYDIGEEKTNPNNLEFFSFFAM